jgi:toluene monooxygenase system ferredoxin subunit
MAFRIVATLDDLWSGEMMALESEGQAVLLVNVDGDIRAYADSCPHLRTRLSQGSLRKNVLACSTHGWEFDARTGQGINPRKACLASFAVKVENGNILVDFGVDIRAAGIRVNTGADVAPTEVDR